MLIILSIWHFLCSGSSCCTAGIILVLLLRPILILTPQELLSEQIHLIRKHVRHRKEIVVLRKLFAHIH